LFKTTLFYISLTSYGGKLKYCELVKYTRYSVVQIDDISEVNAIF